MVLTNSSSYQCDQTRKIWSVFNLYESCYNSALLYSSSEGLPPRQQEGLQPPQAAPPDMQMRSAFIKRRIDSRPVVHEPNATAGRVGIRTARSSLNLFLWPDVLLIWPISSTSMCSTFVCTTYHRKGVKPAASEIQLHVVEAFTNQWYSPRRHKSSSTFWFFSLFVSASAAIRSVVTHCIDVF